MSAGPIADWDDAYANAPHIPGGAEYPARWLRRAEAFRTATPPEVHGYGAHPRQTLDLFRPQGRAHGLVVFVHGGYWRAFDRGHWSHLAAGPLGRGWAVAMPGYVLAPEVRIAVITAMIAEAIEAAAALVPGPIRLAGHSAGGHLVTRQICADSTLSAPVRARIERVVSISGVHDLRPLLRTSINADLGLDAAEAAAESPALGVPQSGMDVRAWVGGAERPEFLRQSALLANIWTGLGAATTLTIAPERHHFDVIEALADPGSDLTAALVSA